MSLSLEQAGLGSFCMTKVGLAVGSTLSQLATGAAAAYTIDGVYQTQKGATATFALVSSTGAALPTLPIGYKQSMAVWLDTAGVFTVTFGPQVPYAAVTDPVGPPSNPGGRCCVGVQTLANNSVGPFIYGTTLFNVAGLTTKYTDCLDLPSGAIA